MKKISKLTSIFLFFVLLGPLSLGCGLKKQPRPAIQSLEIWGVWDDSDVMNDLIKAYEEQNPHIKDINYRKMTIDEYEEDLNKAFQRGQSPDIFLVNHAWMADRRYQMMSLNEATQIYNYAVSAKSGCDKPKTIEEPIIPLKGYQEAYVDAVSYDFVWNGDIFGIPLSIDTLALYYNKDLFKEVNITNPPTTWEELVQDSKNLTKIDEFGNITQSGIALGTGNNIDRSADIFTMLMMQLGSEISEPIKSVSKMTDPVKAGSSELIDPAQTALDFYSSFSDATNDNYTWNPRMHNSIDAFQTGKVAMMINYTYAIEDIRQKAPKLSFDIAEIPQFKNAPAENMVTYPNYWGYVVSSQTRNREKNRPVEAWRFLNYLGRYDQMKLYANQTGNASPRKDIIEEQKNIPRLGVFALQGLKAKSWYQPQNNDIMEIFKENLEDVALNRKSSQAAIKEMETELNIILKNAKQEREESY